MILRRNGWGVAAVAAIVLGTPAVWAQTVNVGSVRTLSDTADINIPGVDVADFNPVAVNVNGSTNLSVRGLLFQGDGAGNVGATIVGPGGESIQVTSNQSLTGFSTSPALTGVDAANLNTILHSIRWQSTGTLRTTLDNLQVGKDYRLQMLVHENSTQTNRRWDIIFDADGIAELAVDDFTSGVRGTGRIWELEFVATSPTILIDFPQGSAPGAIDQNPILQAVVLSRILVPEPASIAIWSLLGMSLAGFGYFRLLGRSQ